jgi:predicted nucleotidyltransferase
MNLQFYPIEKLKKEILQIVGSRLDLGGCSLFFFGSRVTGKGDERSDIDIGIESVMPIRGEIMATIKEGIDGLPMLYTIDLVDFNGVSPVFRDVALQAIERII